MTNDSPKPLAAYVHDAMHEKGPDHVAKALGVSKTTAMAIALGLATKGSVALARSNLHKLRALMGDEA